jgi:hypothetical protein
VASPLQLQPRIDRLAQPIPHKVDTSHGQRNQHAGEDGGQKEKKAFPLPNPPR